MPTQQLNKELLPYLETDGEFRKLSAFFADKCAAELFGSPTTEPIHSYVKAGLRLVLERCHGTVAALCGSPIERVFVRSVMLSFLKNGLPLVFMPAFRNTPLDISEYAEQLTGIEEFTIWYERKYGSRVITHEFLDQEVTSGKMPKEERSWFEELLLLYHYLPFRDAWHVSLQPVFPRFVGERDARPDMLFWRPSTPSLRLLVECDGYQFHGSRESFELDRKRDRALKALGFDVFRFTGRQINLEPIMSAYELSTYLIELCVENNS